MAALPLPGASAPRLLRVFLRQEAAQGARADRSAHPACLNESAKRQKAGRLPLHNSRPAITAAHRHCSRTAGAARPATTATTGQPAFSAVHLHNSKPVNSRHTPALQPDNRCSAPPTQRIISTVYNPHHRSSQSSAHFIGATQIIPADWHPRRLLPTSYTISTTYHRSAIPATGPAAPPSSSLPSLAP